MQRFYVTFPLEKEMELTDGDIHHQVSRVLRAKPGDSFILFNGDGTEREYEVREITKKSLKLLGGIQKNPETE